MNKNIHILSSSILGLAVMFNTGEAQAANQTLNNMTIGNQTLPACVARDGTKAKYVLTDEQANPYSYKLSQGINPPKPGLPRATGAYIVLPRPFTDLVKSNLIMKFVTAHECAHHVLGHTDEINARINDNAWIATIEPAADCAAAKIMRRDYSMSDRDARSGITEFFDLLQQAENNGHPIGPHGSAAIRLQNTLSCLRGAKP